jgi:hypothetical protein
MSLDGRGVAKGDILVREPILHVLLTEIRERNAAENPRREKNIKKELFSWRFPAFFCASVVSHI